jgi:hypothetical protein
MVHTIEQTLEGKEKGGKQFASIRKSMKRTGQMRQSLRRRTDKADHYFMGHPERGLHLLFAQEKFDESSGDIYDFLTVHAYICRHVFAVNLAISRALPRVLDTGFVHGVFADPRDLPLEIKNELGVNQKITWLNTS